MAVRRLVDDPGLREDERGCDIVGMADQRGIQVERRMDEWPDIPDEAIMPGEKLVELSTRADVLVVEDRGRCRAAEPDQLIPDLLLDLRNERASLGKKLSKGREPMPEIRGARRTQLKQRTCSSST